MKSSEPGMAVDRVRQVQRVSPLGNAFLGDILEKCDFTFHVFLGFRLSYIQLYTIYIPKSMEINENQQKSMKINDFQEFDEIHRADRAGRPCQAGAATFSPRKRTFWECLRKFVFIFQLWLVFCAWFSSVQNLNFMKIQKIKLFCYLVHTFHA